MRTSALLLAALFTGIPLSAFAQESALGDWFGRVSWNERTTYSWSIAPDGAFTSGRDGRGHDGGGAWSLDGAHLTLKYADGFRYEGVVSGDAYQGEAFTADGRPFGAFSMSRALKHAAGGDRADP